MEMLLNAQGDGAGTPQSPSCLGPLCIFCQTKNPVSSPAVHNYKHSTLPILLWVTELYWALLLVTRMELLTLFFSFYLSLSKFHWKSLEASSWNIYYLSHDNTFNS